MTISVVGIREATRPRGSWPSLDWRDAGRVVAAVLMLPMQKQTAMRKMKPVMAPTNKDSTEYNDSRCLLAWIFQLFSKMSWCVILIPLDMLACILRLWNRDASTATHAVYRLEDTNISYHSSANASKILEVLENK